MTKYFVDQAGNYLGGFDGATPPAGAVQVQAPPTDGRQKWANGAWAALALVPEVLTPRQFRQALNHFGFRATVDSAIAASDQDTKDWYEFASQFERHHPKTLAMAQAMSFTPDQMDQVWSYGAAL